MSEQNAVMPPPPPPGVILSIFTDAAGRPLVFYISPVEAEQREKYAKLIHTYGGIVERDDRVLQQNNVVQLSSFTWDDRVTVLFDFIDDLLKKGSQCFIDQYRNLPGMTKKRSLHPFDESMSAADAVAHALAAKKQKMSKSTTKFTPEADNYILDQVRMKPRFRTSHKFFEELANHDMLKGHTGNSVRSRYRAHLEHKLTYVFKTDEYDNVELDQNGQRIAIPVSLAKTIKNRFTAEDDFHLCDDIINHVLRNQDSELLRDGGEFPLNENKFSVLISFFDEYARHNPQHSLLSWRDRYRKFARQYGLQRYRNYYLQEIKSKDGPKPMKNLTSRASKEKKKIENNVKRLKKAEVDAEEAAAAAVAHVHSNGHLLGHSSHHHHIPHNHMDAAAVATMAVASRETSALDEEIGEVKNSNIHEALRNVGAEAGRVNIEDDIGLHAQTDDSAIHPNLTGAGDADADEFGEMGLKVEADSQDPLKEMLYLPRDATFEDIFHPSFFQQDSKKVLNRVLDLLCKMGAEDVDKVCDEFEAIGFTRKFLGHILRVTGAHAPTINEYLSHLFRAFENKKDGELGDVLYLHGRNGYWTPEYDELLAKGEIYHLPFQSEESIRMRRAFLALDE